MFITLKYNFYHFMEYVHETFSCICLNFVFCVSYFTLAGVHQPIKDTSLALHSPNRDQVFSGHTAGIHGYLCEFL